MSGDSAHAETGTARPRLLRGALAVLLIGSFAISTGYGMLLLLPLYVEQLGGNEADFGLVMGSAAVPAAVAMSLLVRFPTRIRPHVLLAVACATYGVGAAGVAAAGSVPVLAALGLVLGTAWAIVYTTTPMVVATLVTDDRRWVAFGFATGAQQLGIGLGPVLGVALHGAGIDLTTVFVVAAAFAVLGAASIGVLHRQVPPAQKAGADAAVQLPLGPALARIVRSPAARPLLLVLLAACLFATLTFFQTTYAKSQHLNSDLFYITYTVAVLLARFRISRALVGRDPARIAAASTTLLCASIATFLVVHSNPIVYVLASAGTGIGYGLSLPIFQSEVVALSDDEVRPRVLPLAGLLFQTAVLAFPVLSGTVIVGLGYGAVFALLLAFSLVQVTVAWGLPTRERQPAAPRDVPDESIQPTRHVVRLLSAVSPRGRSG